MPMPVTYTSCSRSARSLGRLLMALVLAPAAVHAGEVLLADDFSAGVLDTATWGVATWTIGDRTQFGRAPGFGSDAGDDWVVLGLDTHNPSAPGVTVLGTEIYSLQNFPVDADGIEFLARARLTTTQPGLVAAFFTYNQQRRKGRWLSDEIDFEVLSKQATNRVLVTSWDDWGAPGGDYEDGVHHLGAYLDLAGYDWRQWNDYAMRWYPDRVEWWLNDNLVHQQSAPVPDQDQPVRASLWAGGTTWPDAHDPSLAPVASSAQNTTYEWQVDYIMVTRLGEGGEPGGDIPAAPSDLSAQVGGNDVALAWADNADDETGFTVYRAWKPKGQASPDFQPVTSLGANASGYTDTAVTIGEHLYRVTAFNAAGESAPSAVVGVTVGSGGKGGGKPGR